MYREAIGICYWGVDKIDPEWAKEYLATPETKRRRKLASIMAEVEKLEQEKEESEYKIRDARKEMETVCGHPTAKISGLPMLVCVDCGYYAHITYFLDHGSGIVDADGRELKKRSKERLWFTI